MPPEEVMIGIRLLLLKYDQHWLSCGHISQIMEFLRREMFKKGDDYVFPVDPEWYIHYYDGKTIGYISLTELRSDLTTYIVLYGEAAKYCDRCRRLCGRARGYLQRVAGGWSNLVKKYIRDIKMVSSRHKESVYVRSLYGNLILLTWRVEFSDGEGSMHQFGKSGLWNDFVEYVRYTGKRPGFYRKLWANRREFADVSLRFAA